MIRRAPVVLVLGLLACTTDLGTPSASATGKSTPFVISRASITRIVADEQTLVWFDDQGNVTACDLPACASTRVLFSGGDAWPAGGTVGSPHAAFLVAGKLFFDKVDTAGVTVGPTSSTSTSTSGTGLALHTLWSCPTSGCPGGATAVPGLGKFVQIKHDEKHLVALTATDLLSCDPNDCTQVKTLTPGPTGTGCNTSADCKDPTKTLCSNTTTSSIYAPGFCVECDAYATSPATCPTTKPFCSGNGACVGCRNESDCPSDKRFCNADTGTCGECEEGRACADGSVCSGGKCTSCENDFGSGKAHACDSENPHCHAGTCSRCDSFANPCKASDVCEESSGACGKACTSTSDCAASQACSNGVCIPQVANGARCFVNEQCPAMNCEGTCGSPNSTPCSSGTECSSNFCASDGLCGGRDNDTCRTTADCRFGSCTAGKCSGSSDPGAPAGPESVRVLAGLAVAGGRVYFGWGAASPSSGTTSPTTLKSCPIDTCPTGVTDLPVTLSYPSYLGSSDVLSDLGALLAADATVLYAHVNRANGIEQCTLPACTSWTPITNGTTTYTLATDPVVVDGTLYLNGGSSNVFYSNPTLGGLRCTIGGCDFGAVDVSFTTDHGDIAHVFQSRPYAVATTAIYWATSLINGETSGNIIVKTPR